MDHTTYHRYNKLVRRGLATPLTHDCGTEYTLRIAEDDETVLQCTSCNSFSLPGLQVKRMVKSQVEEFFAEGYTFDGSTTY
jgi:hypothetical protein